MAYGDLSIDAPYKPNKGIEGGACNRQRCQAEPALYYNHGAHSWYCADCKRDIGDDHINLRGWNLDHRPHCGHGMFETREQMDARANRTPYPQSPATEPPSITAMRKAYPDFAKPKAIVKSSSLERLLRGKRKGRI